MLNIKCASVGLAVATAGGALLMSAPAQAQSDLAQWHHRHRQTLFHRHSHVSVNRNRPRIFIRIYIYNKNNNIAIAGQRARQRQAELIRRPRAIRAVGVGAPGNVGAPVSGQASGRTTGDVGAPAPGRESRPSVVRDRPAAERGQGVAQPNQPQQPQPQQPQPAATHSDAGVVQHSPTDLPW